MPTDQQTISYGIKKTIIFHVIAVVCSKKCIIRVWKLMNELESMTPRGDDAGSQSDYIKLGPTTTFSVFLSSRKTREAGKPVTCFP